MLEEKCGVKILDEAYQSRSLSDFGASSMVWGAFWGLMLQQTLTPRIIDGTVPSDEACWKKWVRALVAIGLIIPWLMITIIFKKTKVDNAYVLLIFETTLPTVLMGISFYFLTDYVNKRIGLLKIDQNDQLPQDSSQVSMHLNQVY